MGRRNTAPLPPYCSREPLRSRARIPHVQAFVGLAGSDVKTGSIPLKNY